MRKLFITVFINLISIGILMAQNARMVTERVFENDTVVIRMNDYPGDVQWQKSIDSTNWADISNAVKNNFVFIADQTTYFRALVTAGTCEPVVSDIVKIYIYKTEVISGQEWMAENLNCYEPVGSWAYENIISNANTYGRLYNWEAACKVCPDGWHLPSDEEWKELEVAIGMSMEDANSYGLRLTKDGLKLKAASGWYENGNGTDEYGFSALPSGSRQEDGTYIGKGLNTVFWSSTVETHGFIFVRSLSYLHNSISRDLINCTEWSFSVRCVRDK